MIHYKLQQHALLCFHEWQGHTQGDPVCSQRLIEFASASSFSTTLQPGGTICQLPRIPSCARMNGTRDSIPGRRPQIVQTYIQTNTHPELQVDSLTSCWNKRPTMSLHLGCASAADTHKLLRSMHPEFHSPAPAVGRSRSFGCGHGCAPAKRFPRERRKGIREKLSHASTALQMECLIRWVHDEILAKHVARTRKDQVMLSAECPQGSHEDSAEFVTVICGVCNPSHFHRQPFGMLSPWTSN